MISHLFEKGFKHVFKLYLWGLFFYLERIGEWTEQVRVGNDMGGRGRVLRTEAWYIERLTTGWTGSPKYVIVWRHPHLKSKATVRETSRMLGSGMLGVLKETVAEMKHFRWRLQCRILKTASWVSQSNISLYRSWFCFKVHRILTKDSSLS